MTAWTSRRRVNVLTVFEHTSAPIAPRDTVTVAVSLFNYARFVGECLESISAQTHPHIDLVVVDDDSRADNSLELARDWLQRNADRFTRASLLKHADNQGLAEARNTAFEWARTDPVFVIDADNQIYPRALGRLHEYVEFREFDAAYTQLELFGEQRRIGLADIWAKRFFRSRNYVDAMALVSKRSWEQVGGYSPMEGLEDYDFWCKFVDMGLKAIYIPEILCRYRIHGSSMSRTAMAAAEERLKVRMTMRHPWLEL
jgi:glycosyltransferase involved in cell wall biosynthesis